jgi:hypothetical protein
LRYRTENVDDEPESTYIDYYAEMPMKKLQLFIVILSFLWISHAMAGVLMVTPAIGNNVSELSCCLECELESLENNIADRVFVYPDFDSNFALHPFISSDIRIEDIRLDIDVDTAESAEGFEMNDHNTPLTSSVLIETSALMVRSIALNVFNFPQEVSRLRI